MNTPTTLQKVAVLVPANPFIQKNLREISQCLAVLDVQKMMEWCPGKPYTQHRDPNKLTAIQRSLDWKRVAQIDPYLLQQEIVDAQARDIINFQLTEQGGLSSSPIAARI
jgi:hypothetical protein